MEVHEPYLTPSNHKVPNTQNISGDIETVQVRVEVDKVDQGEVETDMQLYRVDSEDSLVKNSK